MYPPKPVTLETLNTFSAQAVFDWIVFNLLQQNAKSKDSYGYCLYRGPDGLKCAAGWLIADDEYDLKFEIATWSELEGMLNAHFVHSAMIAHMQRIHDHVEPKNWVHMLRSLAELLSLDPFVVNNTVAR